MKQHSPHKHSQLFFLLLLYLCQTPLKASEISDSKSSRLKITVVRQVKRCSVNDRAKRDDKVFIKQTGWRVDTSQQIDTSGSTPFAVERLGHGSILIGLEKAIDGMCIGEIISVEIPPEMAFYQPGKTFPKRPVPNGIWVRYEIELIDIAVRESSLYFLLTSPFFVTMVFVGVLILWFLMRKFTIVPSKVSQHKAHHLREHSSTDRVVTGGPSLRMGTERPRKGTRLR